MLIDSMSVSVDGFIADREGAFEWGAPSVVGQLRKLLGLTGRFTADAVQPLGAQDRCGSLA